MTSKRAAFVVALGFVGVGCSRTSAHAPADASQNENPDHDGAPQSPIGNGFGSGVSHPEGGTGAAGEDRDTNVFVHPLGDATRGQTVFRTETFGNEGFWTRAVKLPQGIEAVGLTPLLALRDGINFDIDAVPEPMKTQLVAEAKTDLTPAHAPALNDPHQMIILLKENAVVGLVPKNIKKIDSHFATNDAQVYEGESLGVACAFCHSITDGSVYALPSGGGIGHRQDGRANHELNFGRSVANALNARAYYPQQALYLDANHGKSISRKGPGVGLISKKDTEAEMKAYLRNPELYPVGTFDDAPDGNGVPVHNSPAFRQDLAAPYGSDGSIEQLQNFSNFVYTVLLDPTDLTTPGGRQFLQDRGGDAGVEIADNYEKILADLGVPKGGPDGYPFVARAGNADVTTGLAAGAKVEKSLIGIRVNEQKLEDMNAYMDQQRPPNGVRSDETAIARGRKIFETDCVSCHNADQSQFVPQNLVPFNSSVDLFARAPARPALFPSYQPKLVADRSAAGLVPIKDDSTSIFDDKWAVNDASVRNQPRGAALPLLMDLARKPVFLHDNSVSSLDALMSSKRGAGAPHPFYVDDPTDRAGVVAFLNSLDDRPLASE